jgi:hypothetical protein
MSSLRSPEGITFGDAEHLPGAEVLSDITPDWPQHTMEGTVRVARTIQDPNSVARHMGILDEDTAHNLVQTGVRHFGILQDNGLAIPPQRFVFGPGLYGSRSWQPTLYSITDFIDGRPLTSEPEDTIYAPDTLRSHAGYLSDVYNRVDEEVFMWDISFSWQHTVTTAGKVVLHDVDLEMIDTYSRKRPSKSSLHMISAAIRLEQWAKSTGVNVPEIDSLIKQVEPWPRRALRKTLEALIDLAPNSQK